MTLGANDLKAMKIFYGQILGWTALAENDDIVFYGLNGFLLSICDRKMLADFIGIDPEGQGFRAVTIGYNVGTKEEVLALYRQLKAKVNIVKEPSVTPFGGLFFYFSDIEGNIIEIAQSTYLIYDEKMNAIGHKPIDDL